MHPQDTPARIPLHARDGSVRAYALVDQEDAALAEHRWCLSYWGYAVRSVPKVNGQRQPQRRLHREVLGLGPGNVPMVDHENLDKLDCRRANLRIATRQQNSQNRPSHAGARSQYRGVSWSKRARKWHAQVCIAGVRHHVGLFDDEREAGRAAAAFRAAHMPFSTT